jgi:hypothetical protein
MVEGGGEADHPVDDPVLEEGCRRKPPPLAPTLPAVALGDPMVGDWVAGLGRQRLVEWCTGPMAECSPRIELEVSSVMKQGSLHNVKCSYTLHNKVPNESSRCESQNKLMNVNESTIWSFPSLGLSLQRQLSLTNSP